MSYNRNVGLHNIMSSQPGLPASMNSNSMSPTPETLTVRVSQSPNGVESYNPNGTVRFNINAGAGTGFFKRSTGSISFFMDVELGNGNGNFDVNSKFESSRHSYDTVHTLLPQCKLNNPSAIKATQSLKLNNTDIYSHNSLNVLIEQHGVLADKNMSNLKTRMLPVGQKMNSADEYEDIKNYRIDTTKGLYIRYAVTMPLDCPLLDHEYQDLPLFLMKGTLVYEFSLEKDLRIIFDPRTVPVSTYSIHNLTLNYDSLLVGTAYERSEQERLNTTASHYEMVFNSYICPNLLPLEGKSIQFNINGVYSSINGIAVAPYTKYNYLDNTDNRQKIRSFNEPTTNISTFATLQSLKEEPAFYGGSGFYDDKLPSSMIATINGSNIIERELKPSSHDSRVIDENIRFVSGCVSNNDGDQYNIYDSRTSLMPAMSNSRYCGVALNCTKINDNDMSFPGVPSTGTIHISFSDNPRYKTISNTFTCKSISEHYSIVGSNNLVATPATFQADETTVASANALPLKCNYTTVTALDVVPAGGYSYYTLLQPEIVLKMERTRELYTFVSFTKSLSIDSGGDISMVI